MKIPVKIVAFLFLFLPAFLFAEIELKYYQEDQSVAPEYIDIKVLKVKKEWCFFCPEREIRVKAKVIAVHRSAAGLKIGDVIKIKYKLFKPPKKWTGPRPLPLLKKKKMYPAFLKKTGRHFSPAARGYSFGPVLAGSG